MNIDFVSHVPHDHRTCPSVYVYRRHYTEGAPFDSGLRPRQKDASLTPTPSPTAPVPYTYNMHDLPTTAAGEGKGKEDADVRSDVSNKSVHSTIEPAGDAEDTNTHSKYNSPKRHQHSTEGGRRKSSAHSPK